MIIEPASFTPRVNEARRLLSAVIAVPGQDLLIAFDIQEAAAELENLGAPHPPPPMWPVPPSTDLTGDLDAAISLLNVEIGDARTAAEAIHLALVMRQLQEARDELAGP